MFGELPWARQWPVRHGPFPFSTPKLDFENTPQAPNGSLWKRQGEPGLKRLSVRNMLLKPFARVLPGTGLATDTFKNDTHREKTWRKDLILLVEIAG
jgi:hypothetical protein